MKISSEEYMKVFSNESQSGIICQIITFGSLNLKLLSKMINKSESTTLGHVKKLIVIGYIELDKEESELRWGKFYKITEKTIKAIQDIDQMGKHIAETTGDVQKGLLLSVARTFQAIASWPSNITYYTGVFMEENVDEILSSADPIKTKEKIFFMNPKISIKTIEEWFEFKEIMEDFHKKILKFHDFNAPMTQYLSLISVPIQEIHPIKEKRHSSIK